MRYRWFLFLWVAPAAGACHSSETLEPASYDQRCVVDADCTTASRLERSGSLCSYACPAPVSRAGRARYDEDVARLEAECSEHAEPGCLVGGVPGCVASRCAFVAADGGR